MFLRLTCPVDALALMFLAFTSVKLICPVEVLTSISSVTLTLFKLMLPVDALALIFFALVSKEIFPVDEHDPQREVVSRKVIFFGHQLAFHGGRKIACHQN